MGRAGFPSWLLAPLAVCNPLGGPEEEGESRNSGFSHSAAVVLGKSASRLLDSPLCKAGPARPSLSAGRLPRWSCQGVQGAAARGALRNARARR